MLTFKFTVTNIFPNAEAPPGVHYYAHTSEAITEDQLRLALFFAHTGQQARSPSFTGEHTRKSLEGLLFDKEPMHSSQRDLLHQLGYNYVGRIYDTSAVIWGNHVHECSLNLYSLNLIVETLVRISEAAKKALVLADNDVTWNWFVTNVTQLIQQRIRMSDLDGNLSVAVPVKNGDLRVSMVPRFAPFQRFVITIPKGQIGVWQGNEWVQELIPALRSSYPTLFSRYVFNSCATMTFGTEDHIVEVTDDQLIPCPFCKSGEVKTYRGKVSNHVGCKSCDCKGPASMDVAYAQFLWNNRRKREE